MKGLELPINVLIIIALAVIVLIAVVAFFYPSFFSGSQTVGVESAKSSACQVLVTGRNCNIDTNDVNITNFDADQDSYIGAADTGMVWTWGASTCGGVVTNAGDNLAALCAC